MSNKTIDPVNQIIVDTEKSHGVSELGIHVNLQWQRDPKHLLFSLSRYKFVGKMLAGHSKVAEIGCGDGFNSRLVRQHVKSLDIYDIDPIFIANASKNAIDPWLCGCYVHDITEAPLAEKYSAIYSLDVLEHISKEKEDAYMDNILSSLDDNGVAIIGMPSLESQVYTLPQEETGHVNCKKGPELKDFLNKYFHNVFLFSMNDEVLHTGFSPMSHYLICICSGKR